MSAVHRWRQAAVHAVAGFCLTAGATGAVADGFPMRVIARESKALERRLDPVVLTARDAFPTWIGTPIDRVRAFAIADDKLGPVPFQIDQVSPEGRPLYEFGIRNDSRLLDDAIAAEDELVLISSEAGARPPPDFTIPGAAETLVVTLEAPADGDAAPGRAWFLLARFDTDPPVGAGSTRALLAQKMRSNLVFSDHYTVRFHDFYPGSHSLVPSEMRIPVEAGGTGVDFLDRFKWRVHFSLLWGLYRVSFDEQKVNVRVLSWSEGPVRVRRYVTMRVRLPLGIEGPTIDMYADFYPQLIQIPIEIGVPTSPGFLSAHTDFVIGADLAPAGDGMQFISSENPDGFLVDGWMSGPELKQHHEPARWWLWTGEQGTVLQRNHWDEAYRNSVDFRHEYIDDDDSSSPPEEFSGERGALYERMGVDDIEPGTYHGLLEWWFPSWMDYEPGDEVEVLSVYDAPLRVSVGAWSGEAFPLTEVLRR